MERDIETVLDHGGKRMILQSIHPLESHPRKGTHRERDRITGEPFHQVWILKTAVSVVDSLDSEDVQRTDHILGRPFFPGVGDGAKTKITGYLLGRFE